MKEILYYLKKEWPFLFVFILLISISQSLMLKPHLEFGFSPDDIWFFSDFANLGSNPFLKFYQVWQQAGPYHTPPIYYNGILFSLFGFNHQAYQIASLIFKILSVVSLYVLIQVVFKNRLLALMSGLLFSINYASVGSFEMVSRTQDYLLITAMNIFFIFFYLINKRKPKNIIWTILLSATFFFSFFINPIRAYPFFLFILFLGAINYFRNKSVSNLWWVLKIQAAIFLPFFVFYILMGAQGAPYGNFLTNIHNASLGNLQVFLTPLTTIGGLFLAGDGLKFLSPASWDINSFFTFFMGGPLLILGLFTLLLSIILSKKPFVFFVSVFTVNFILELIIFLIINHVLNLPPEIKINYDAKTYAPAAILGVYILVLSVFIFKEWLNNRKNISLSLYLIGIIYALTSILLTWILQDYVYIPLGINGYSTLPSMGVSVSISALMILAYEKLKGNQHLKVFAPSIFLILIPYLIISNNQIQTYFKRYLDGGGMRASDQVSLKNQFWQFVKQPESCNKFFYLDLKSDPQNRYSYNVIMTDRFDKWYDLYGPFQAKIHCPVALLLDDEKKLLSAYSSSNNEAGFYFKDYDGKEKFYQLENFYAFRLQNSDIVDIKSEVLTHLSR